MIRIENAQGAPVATVLAFGHPFAAADDRYEILSPGVYRLTRTFTATVRGTVPVSGLCLDVETLYPPEFLMVPAVSYNGNPWGDGKEPTGFAFEGTPWTFASHRAAIPGGTFSRGGGLSLGLSGDPSRTGGAFSCSLFPRNGRAVHRLIAPEEEMPRSYLVKGRLDEGYRGTLLLHPDRPFVLSAVLVAGQGDDRSFLDTAWEMGWKDRTPWFDPDRIWELGVTFAKESLWAEEGSFRGFSIGLSDDGAGGWAQRPENRYESGWCGQNISLGVSLLYDHLRSGDADSLAKGLSSLDAWSAAVLPCGLFCTQYDPLLGLSPLDGLAIDACNLGGAAENFLEAWEMATACGHPRPAYLETARGILAFSLRHQAADGSFPSAYRADGQVLATGGSTGGFLLPAMAWLHVLTGDAGWLDGAVRGYAHYVGDFRRDGFTTAGALDSYCIDKESAYPLLSTALMLYRATGSGAYLEDAVALAYYLSTWQWHHSVPFPEGSALHDMGYDTFGGTAVSTQHHHIDAYALKYVPSLRLLADLTGDDIWRRRAQAAWDNATIGISDGTLSVMGRVRPRGGQDEAFLHTRWQTPFQVCEWLVAWPTAFRLEVLRRTRFFTRADMGDGIRV